MTLTPAYGRDYKSAKAVLADFRDNKDFIINDITSPWDGKPCNRSDLLKEGITQVMIRYRRLTRIVKVEIKENNQ